MKKKFAIIEDLINTAPQTKADLELWKRKICREQKILFWEM